MLNDWNSIELTTDHRTMTQVKFCLHEWRLHMELLSEETVHYWIIRNWKNHIYFWQLLKWLNLAKTSGYNRTAFNSRSFVYTVKPVIGIDEYIPSSTQSLNYFVKSHDGKNRNHGDDWHEKMDTPRVFKSRWEIRKMTQMFWQEIKEQWASDSLLFLKWHHQLKNH